MRIERRYELAVNRIPSIRTSGCPLAPLNTRTSAATRTPTSESAFYEVSRGTIRFRYIGNTAPNP